MVMNIVPGPGQYESTDNSSGKYQVSSLRNTVGNIWGMSKTDRFDKPSKEYYIYLTIFTFLLF